MAEELEVKNDVVPGDEEVKEVGGEVEVKEVEKEDEKKVDSVIAGLKKKLEVSDSLQARMQNMVKAEPVGELAEDDILTVAQVKKLVPAMVNKMEEQKERARATYENVYMKSVINLGVDMKPEEHDAVVQLMLSKYNDVITGNAKVDAELNFLKAEKELLKGGKKNKFRSEKAPVGEGVKTQSDAPPKVDIKLDKFAEEFVKATGMSAEAIQRALGKEK